MAAEWKHKTRTPFNHEVIYKGFLDSLSWWETTWERLQALRSSARMPKSLERYLQLAWVNQVHLELFLYLELWFKKGNPKDTAHPRIYHPMFHPPFLPSHSNSLLLSDGVSMPSRSNSVLSSSSSESTEPSLRSRFRLISGANSLFFVFLPLFESYCWARE